MRYEVKIKHVKRDEPFAFKFYWDVDTYQTNGYEYSLNGSGYARTLAKAKKKALKHILKTEKLVGDSSVPFGVIMSVSGSAKEVAKVLTEESKA